MPLRKPTAVLEMSGALKKNPARGRARANEPQVDGKLGNAPSHLSDDAKKVWGEIRKRCQWVTEADWITVEEVCIMTVRMRQGGMKASDFNTLRSLLSELGMTPVSRSKVQAQAKTEKTVDDDPWAILQRPSDTVRKPSNKRNDSGLPSSTASVPKTPFGLN